MRIVLCLVLSTNALLASSARLYTGMSLTDALLLLQKSGLPLLFSSQMVRPEMRVMDVPAHGDPRQILKAIVTPHALDIEEGPNGVLVVIRARKPAVSTASVARPRLTLTEEIVVESRDTVPSGGSTGLTTTEIESLPHFGNDALRAVTLLPGAGSKDTSAELHIRGGRSDELLIRLDGQELYEPYHLRDFDNALSIVSASRLSKMNLVTAPPASYGGRTAGLLDMSTPSPSTQPKFRLGISFLDADTQVANTMSDGRLGWSASFRRGTTDVLGRTIGTEAPSFSDLFARVDYQLTRRQSLQIHDLASIDELNFIEDDESKRLDTEYLGHYLWLTHRAIVSDALTVESSVSTAQTRRDRGGAEIDPERSFEVFDRRVLDVTGIAQRWSFRTGIHEVSNGFQYERFKSSYDYSGSRRFDTPLAQLRTDGGRDVLALKDRIRHEQFSIYASDRISPARRMTIDVGLRYDGDRDDRIVLPRLGAAFSVASNIVHVGYGQYSQSQRPYEVMVADGDARVYPAERSRQWVGGIEHLFAPASRLPFESLRLEAYRRTVSNPRPRYRNLFDAFDPFPEGQFDRIRVEPQRSTAQGAEILLRGRPTPRMGWWMNYAIAVSRDRIDGKEVPRETDHTHTFNADMNYALRRNWNLNLGWTYRTGWPTTPLTILEKNGELVPVLGPVHSRRLPAYHRLDLRLSRDWALFAGTFTFYADARNLYNRRNAAGIDVQLAEETLITDTERWPGLVGSMGVAWRSR